MKTVFKNSLLKIISLFCVRENFLNFLAYLTPVAALVSGYIWFVHTYAMTPWDLYIITKRGLPTLEKLEVLPGYLDIEDLPGFLEQRRTTIETIRDMSDEFDFRMYDLVKLAKCESTINPAAVNRYSGARGLFQYLPKTWGTTPYCAEDIWDVEAQTKATIWMFEHNRYTEWECFRSRELKEGAKYPRQYLNECR